MLELVVDPVLLAPPRDGDTKGWMERLGTIGALIGQSCLRATCAERARDCMVALWYSEQDLQDGPAAHELARVAHESASRLKEAPGCAEGTPLLEGLSVDPAYVAEGVDPGGRAEFEGHLGEAACAKRDGSIHVGVLGPAESWERESEEVVVEAEILGRDDELAGLVEAEETEAQLREILQRSDSVEEVLKSCCDHPGALLNRPDFGVRALWAAQFGGDPWELEFEIGPDFAASVKSMNYEHRPGEARRCLRVMALIAGGRAAEVDGHEERETAEATSAIQTDRAGNTVIRSRLQNQVADAHRLFWARGPTPVFLNVTGHQGGPAIQRP